MKNFLGCVALLVICGAVSAQCRNVIRTNHVVTPAVVVADVVPVAVAQFVPLAIPSYGHAFGEPEQIRTLNAKVDAQGAKIDALTQALSGQQPKQPLMPRADLPQQESKQDTGFVALVQQNCAQCHSAGNNPKKNLALVNFGKVLDPSPEQLGEIINRISSDDPGYRMPPAGLDAGKRLKMIHGFSAAPETAQK